METPQISTYLGTTNTLPSDLFYRDASPLRQETSKSLQDLMMQYQYESQIDKTKPQPQKEKPMSKKRVVQVFIVDTDENLSSSAAMLYQSEQMFTDLTDQELFFEVDIKPILESHNGKRKNTLDKKATNRTGKDVFLEPLRIRDLKMVVSTVAEF